MLSTSGKLCIETNPEQEGVFSARVKHLIKKRLKLMVSKGNAALTYDLRSDGIAEVFPFQLENGRYEITLCEQTTGNKYAKVGTVNLFIKMGDPMSPFLKPNQYVKYEEDSDVVLKARSLCFNKTHEQAYATVCEYIKSFFVYDFIKAATTKTHLLPDIEHTFSNHKGICQDLSAVTVAMLRSQGIPSRLIIGNADRQYHSWVETWIGDEWKRFDPTFEINGIPRVRNYKIERYY